MYQGVHIGVHSHTVPMYSYSSIAVVYIGVSIPAAGPWSCGCPSIQVGVVRASNHGNPAPHPNVLINRSFDVVVEVDSILMWCGKIWKRNLIIPIIEYTIIAIYV